MLANRQKTSIFEVRPKGRKLTDVAVSYDPAADGSVFTLAQIDTHLRREKLASPDLVR